MIGERIRQARLVAGLTQDEVVKGLAVLGYSLTKAGLSKYEIGKSVPKPALMLKLAQVLNVRPSYFLEDTPDQIEWIAFRRHSKLAAGVQDQIKAYSRDVVAYQAELLRILHIEEAPNLPEQQEVTNFDAAEAAAEYVREFWGLDEAPVENFIRLVEAHGVVVLGWQDHVGQFDGLSGWTSNHIPVAVVNMTVELDRRRFNLAHELGHLIMNCEGLSEKDQEKLAHRFAAAFLAPASSVRRELGERRRQIDWHELGLLKQKYGLSMAAWIYRAKDLEIISSSYAQTLWRDLSAQGWRIKEPYPFVGFEEPMRLRQMALRGLAEGIITEERAREICPDCFAPIELPVKPYSARELLKLPPEERDQLVAQALERTADEDTEIFDAFGDEDFDDE